MEGLAKTLDSAIKAPLWFWCAIMLASGIPMFNIPNLVEIGIGADYKLFGVPLALIALVSTALFITSAAARLVAIAGETLAPALERARLWLSLRSLGVEQRALLSLLEDEDRDEFIYLPDDPGLRALRDAGFIVSSTVGDDRSWGQFRLTHTYGRTLGRYRPSIRRTLRSSDQAIETVRGKLQLASRASQGLGGLRGYY